MQQQSPVEVLFSAYHRRILALLLLHPERSFHVREIARLTEVPAGSVHRELRRLAESGLLVRESVGNQVRYHADHGCQIFMELAGIFRKTAGLADVLREVLEPLASGIEIAFIPDSVAQGREGAYSDVDVLVVGSASFARVVQAFASVQERIGREINPAVMSTSELRKKYARGDRFVTRIFREPKIYLTGTEDDFGKLVEDQTA